MPRRYPKSLSTLSIIILSALLFTPHPLYAEDKIIAVVNNDIITSKDYNDFLTFLRMQLAAKYSGRELESKIQSMKLDLLDRLIEDKLILQEAKKAGIVIDEGRVKAKMDEIRERYPSEGAFDLSLAKQGLTRADIQGRMREQLLMLAIVDGKIKNKIIVNPQEVTAFYEKNKEKFKSPEGRVISSIKVEKPGQLHEVESALRKNCDMKGVADRYNLPFDTIEAYKGGELSEEVEKVVFDIGEGKFSRPLKINESFFIFKVEKIKGPRNLSLPEVQNEIYTVLFEDKMQAALVKWLDELKKQSYIQVSQD